MHDEIQLWYLICSDYTTYSHIVTTLHTFSHITTTYPTHEFRERICPFQILGASSTCFDAGWTSTPCTVKLSFKDTRYKCCWGKNEMIFEKPVAIGCVQPGPPSTVNHPWWNFSYKYNGQHSNHPWWTFRCLFWTRCCLCWTFNCLSWFHFVLVYIADKGSHPNEKNFKLFNSKFLDTFFKF